MRALGNILWHIPFLGFVNAGLTFLLGLLLTATVVAAPIGLGLMQLGKFFLAPFGHEMVARSDAMPNQDSNPAWKTYSTIVMIIWLPLGLLLAIGTIIQVILLFISILGIPVAAALAKTVGTMFNPVGKVCVTSEAAAEIRKLAGLGKLAG
ncbi:YccF domain-containing protein [Magnetospirillum moscoviense]|uniref:Inner membrane component domain-containing protein n=1 Tax=Magnetospirillum moscoviense TaxID=1437059 RepID=A0A178MYN8_9PROT|nr:YccF domain-containing protein [Magnetospirillum moscoviense]MBF0323454.1 hypothetical protein [Alphaproteobacteria bacterium]OAN64767.1 hypothetical protein A6A05_18970 [Magnetospirillum moscoviense]